MTHDDGLIRFGITTDRSVNAKDLTKEICRHDLIRSSVGYEMAILDHEDAIEESHGNRDVMQDHHDHASVIPVEILKKMQKRKLVLDIKTRQRLIEQKLLRRLCQQGGDSNALSLSTGETFHTPVDEMLDFTQLDG